MNLKCEKCGSGNVAHYQDRPHVASKCHDCRWYHRDFWGKNPEPKADQMQWAEGCDPKMHVDEDGDFVAGNDKYPFWQKKNSKGEDIRLLDNVVECVNNAGMEDQFDEGVEYIFEGASNQEMIVVFDKCGVERECFTDRFKVISSEHGALYHTHFVKPEAAVEADCPICDEQAALDALSDIDGLHEEAGV